MNGDFNWIKDEKDADFMYGGEQFEITDEDIERLKKGDILNFFVNMEYGCTLKYKKGKILNPINKNKPKWLAKDFHTLFCSECDFYFDIMTNDFLMFMNFCPNCGSDMRGKKNEDS